MAHTEIPLDLLTAYQTTEYWVGAEPDSFCLRLEEHSPSLALLFDAFGHRCAAYITAHNPFSSRTSVLANAAAHERLRDELIDRCVHIIEGVGRDSSGRWPPETSFLALGLELDPSKEIAKRLGQNAIVWSGSDAVPRLVLLR